ncbi:MAG: hypothetical protein ACTHMM_12095 [Agriterribacter sp.]
MRLWKRKHKKEGNPEWQENIAYRILNGYRVIQTRWVKLMERTVGKLSLRAQKTGCIVLMLGGTVYCTATIYSGIKNKQTYQIKVDAINRGKHLGKTGEDSMMQKYHPLTYKDYQHLQHFMAYLDSLQKSETGRLLYDSIARTHPGLLDSISILRKIYFDK